MPPLCCRFLRGLIDYDVWPLVLFGSWCAAMGFVAGFMVGL